MSNTTGAFSGAGTAYPSIAAEVPSFFVVVLLNL